MDVLIKRLQEFIEKNKELIVERPEILINLKDKLAKADDPDELSFDDMDFDHQDHDMSDEDLAGLSIIDQDDLEGDAADAWLKDNDPSMQAEPEADEVPEAEISDAEATPPAEDVKAAPEKKARGGKWKPNEANYTDDHKSMIEEHMNNGFSHREAERMAGAHAGHNDFESAYHGSHDQEEPSAAFMEQLLPHANEFIGNWEKMKRRDADASKNPELYHAGKITAGLDEHRKSYDDAWKEYQDSDEYKGMDMFDQMDAQANFKKKYHEDNPEHTESYINMSTKDARGQAKEAYEQNFNEQLEGLLTAHLSAPDAMSEKDVGQHLGGEKTEGGGYVAGKKKDPMASFVEQNPQMKDYAQKKLLNTQKYKDLMTPEQHERLTRVSGLKGGKTGGEE